MVKISIVLPVFNGEDYLGETIDSVLAQSFQDWELIVVDDCSVDSTPDIIKKYVELDSRIHGYRNEVNSKTPTTLNNGFERAQGSILAWTADDNRYYPDALQVLWDYMTQHPDADFVYTDVNFIDENGKYISTFAKDFVRMYYNCCAGGCFAFKKEIYERVGRYKKEFFPIEDYEFVLRIMLEGGKVERIPTVMYDYRIYSGSQTSKYFYRMKELLNSIRAEHFDWFFSHLAERKEYLFGMYIDMCITGSCTSQMKERFAKELPEVAYISELPDDASKVMIYGAGDFGQRAYSLLKDRVCGFADRSETKIGGTWCGLPVISPKEMLKNKDDYHVLIALESDVVYGVVRDFHDKGMEDIFLFQKMNNLAFNLHIES